MKLIHFVIFAYMGVIWALGAVIHIKKDSDEFAVYCTLSALCFLESAR